MRAEVAFGGGMGIRVQIERIVGTGLHARLASDATVAVEIDDAVVATKECSRRTYFNAGRVVAMVAAHHAEMAAGVRKLTFFNVFDPGAEDAERDVMLFLAGDRARMTPDAAVVIDYEAVPQFDSPQQPARSDRPADSSC
jgi:hypothetical protein